MKKSIFIATALMGALSMSAQEAAPKATTYRTFGLSLESGHYYDLQFTSFDDLLNGASGEDMRGLNGPGTTFDVGFGARATYYYSPLTSFDFAFDKATVTGANFVETHVSKNTAYTLGMNINLKKGDLQEEYTFVPFGRIGFGMLNYDAQRSFVSDGIEFSNRIGGTTHTEVGGGVVGHINDGLSVRMMSVLRVINSDAWDGYDYSSGKDHLMKTTVSVEYAFGKSRHMNRLPSYRDARVAALQQELAILKSDSESAMKMITENSAKQNKLAEDLEKMKEGMDALVEQQEALAASKASSASSSLETYNIYYAFNEARPNDQFTAELQSKVFALTGQDVVFTIQAFSDPKGTKLQNSLVRARRIAQVKSLLKGWGIEEANIEVLEWDGTYTGTDSLDRRVEIGVRKK
jgi:hypothetical protein